jgi:Tfp pilus assembly protein PilN
MQATTVDRRHSDAMLKALERQRNDALTREVQKDAVNVLLQDQVQALKTAMDAMEATLKERDQRIAQLESEAAQRDKPADAPANDDTAADRAEGEAA